jgi:primase-polymerase (primpol)-like protein
MTVFSHLLPYIFELVCFIAVTTAADVFRPDIIPAELRQRKQWLLWRFVHHEGEAKPRKTPYDFMGYRIDPTNPKNWSPFPFLLDWWRARPDGAAGLGFAFSPDDPYTGIDLDDVWQSDADEGAPWALRILERFRDSYGEPSPSDTGAKIWCIAKVPRCGSWKLGNGAIEIYDRKRFFTVTGRGGPRTITDHQADITALVSHLDNHGGRSAFSAASRIGASIPEGSRHYTLVSLAGTMYRRGMCLAAIEAALLVVNEKQCSPPQPVAEIRSIIQSAERWSR